MVLLSYRTGITADVYHILPRYHTDTMSYHIEIISMLNLRRTDITSLWYQYTHKSTVHVIFFLSLIPFICSYQNPYSTEPIVYPRKINANATATDTRLLCLTEP